MVEAVLKFWKGGQKILLKKQRGKIPLTHMWLFDLPIYQLFKLSYWPYLETALNYSISQINVSTNYQFEKRSRWLSVKLFGKLLSQVFLVQKSSIPLSRLCS